MNVAETFKGGELWMVEPPTWGVFQSTEGMDTKAWTVGALWWKRDSEWSSSSDNTSLARVNIPKSRSSSGEERGECPIVGWRLSRVIDALEPLSHPSHEVVPFSLISNAIITSMLYTTYKHCQYFSAKGLEVMEIKSYALKAIYADI